MNNEGWAICNMIPGYSLCSPYKQEMLQSCNQLYCNHAQNESDVMLKRQF